MPKNRRRYLRYSLRTAMLVVLTLSVWLGWQANRAARQREAVAALREIDAVVRYDFQEESFQIPEGPRPTDEGGLPIAGTPGSLTTPQWLVDLLGVDALHRVVSVRILDHSFDDEDMASLSALPDLRRVYLVDTSISDSGLAHLKGHIDLEILELDRTHMTDAGLAHLRGLEKLEFLGAVGTGVTKQGAQDLMDRLPRLGIVYFGGGDALHELARH